MTCKEMLKLDHPEVDYNSLQVMLDDTCPSDYGYTHGVACRDFNHDCDKCWMQEVQGGNKLIYAHIPGNEIGKVEDIKEENGGITATIKPIIKDSGDRTEFESGAVRDMREGKGRCDLMPLEVVAYLYPGEHGDIFNELAEFKKTGNAECLYSALCKFATVAYDRNITTMFLDVAKHFEEGAVKYGPDNWRRGIPTWCYIDSAIRHYLKWYRGDDDEPHNRAFVWNLMCCIWEVDYHKEESD